MQRNPEKWTIKKVYSPKFGAGWVLWPPGKESHSIAFGASQPPRLNFDFALQAVFPPAFRKWLRKQED